MFTHVVCGGTFDHLHVGHKRLLEACKAHGKRITVGVTSDLMASSKLYPLALESYIQRRRSVANALNRDATKATVVKLDDIYGPTLSDTSIDAICVTKDTENGAKLINKKRIKIGMKPLSIILVPFVYADDGSIVASECVRGGQMSRNGISYKKLIFSKSIYYLPKTLVQRLRIPLGHVFSHLHDAKKAIMTTIGEKKLFLDKKWHITVGDITTAEFKNEGFSPFFSIIDGSTQRKALNAAYVSKIIEKEHYDVLNSKGTISSQAVEAIAKNFNLKPSKATKQIIVRGEEDLLVLPVVLLAPLGAVVWYGIRDKGVVMVEVTEKKKETVYNLIQRFTDE